MNTMQTRRKVRGFTLVEALVALLALSIGLLGVAALQMTGLRNNLSASFRSQATYMAYDIVDRMRANRSNAAAYNLALGATPGTGSIAGSDLTAWRNNLATTLPSGTGSVRVVNVNGLNTVLIVVQWDDSRGDTTDGENAIQFETRTTI